MTYEERQRYRHLRERLDRLRERLEEGATGEPLTRAEGLELLEVLSATVERVSPERWDRALDAVAREAARRAGTASGPFGG